MIFRDSTSQSKEGGCHVRSSRRRRPVGVPEETTAVGHISA